MVFLAREPISVSTLTWGKAALAVINADISYPGRVEGLKSAAISRISPRLLALDANCDNALNTYIHRRHITHQDIGPVSVSR